MPSFRVVNTAHFAPQPRVVAAGGGARGASSAKGRAALEALAELLDRGLGDALASGALSVEDFLDAVQAVAEGDANGAGVLGGLVRADDANAFGELLTGNTNSRYRRRTEQRGQGTDLLGLGKTGFGVESLDLLSEGPPQLERTVPTPVLPHGPAIATTELNGEIHVVGIQPGKDFYRDARAAIDRYMAALAASGGIKGGPKAQPGPDGGGPGYGALAARLLARLGGVPIVHWGNQSPSNVGPRVNPGREPASGGPSGPAPVVVVSPNDAPKRGRPSAAARAVAARNLDALRRRHAGTPGPRPPVSSSELAALVAAALSEREL